MMAAVVCCRCRLWLGCRWGPRLERLDDARVEAVDKRGDRRDEGSLALSTFGARALAGGQGERADVGVRGSTMTFGSARSSESACERPGDFTRATLATTWRSVGAVLS